MTGQRYKDELVTGEVNAASHYGPRAVESALPSQFAQSGGVHTVVVPFNAEGPHELLTLDNASIMLPDTCFIESVHLITTETFDDLAQAYDIGVATIDGVDADAVGFSADAVPGTAGTHGIAAGAAVGANLYATNVGTMWQVTVTPKAGVATIGSVNVHVKYVRALLEDRADNS